MPLGIDVNALYQAVIAFLIGIDALVFWQVFGIKKWLFSQLTPMFAQWSTPEGRQEAYKEIAHGVMRAASERAGALQGASMRQAGAQANQSLEGLALGGLASVVPRKYHALLPFIAPYIQQFLGKQMPMMEGAPTPTSGGQPP